jgi:hypothetical protein
VTQVDQFFLVGCLGLLAGMLLVSAELRAVAWECLRHPLSKGWLEVRGGQVIIHRGESLAEARARAGQ